MKGYLVGRCLVGRCLVGVCFMGVCFMGEPLPAEQAPNDLPAARPPAEGFDTPAATLRG